jgi:hypothetical protein
MDAPLVSLLSRLTLYDFFQAAALKSLTLFDSAQAAVVFFFIE